MDDPYFDHRSAKRFDRQRASGPFGVDEVLPKKVATWVNRKHPDSGKKQILLNFTDWQKGQAARIVSDFELHTYEWTLTAVKFRESLDKQDRRDLAQSVFARDRDGRLLPAMLQIRNVSLARADDDADAVPRLERWQIFPRPSNTQLKSSSKLTKTESVKRIAPFLSLA